MIQTTERGSSQVELGRFFTAAQMCQQETGEQAFMPACPVDTEWHQLLNSPDEYRAFCHDVLGRDILHEPAQGEGKIGWAETYEKLYGPLPEVWFQRHQRNPQQVAAAEVSRHRSFLRFVGLHPLLTNAGRS